MLVYPSYQYITTRQDESSNTGFFETLQNYIINFGGQNSQNDESNQIMDAVMADKPLQPIQETKSTIPQEKFTPIPSETKQKFFYSYITPASTVPLNNDRRLFLLSEQPQVLGTFSGPALNPVFNLQPVPVVLSRSNVAQPVDAVQPATVVAEKAPEVGAVPQVQVKSVASEQSDSVVIEAAAENRVAPVVQNVVPVEDNRAIPVSTEPSVEVKAAVVEARGIPIPLLVSGEPIVAPVVDTPAVDGVVEGNEAVQPNDVVATYKEVPAVNPSVVVPSVVVPAVAAANQFVPEQKILGGVDGNQNIPDPAPSLEGVQPIQDSKVEAVTTGSV